MALNIITKYSRLLASIRLKLMNNGFLDKLNIILFSILIFLLRLPSLYIIPIHSSIFQTNNISRLIILFIFISNYFISNSTQLFFNRKYTNLFIIILFYFLTQSVSIIKVVNINNYLLVYKDLIFALLLFIICLQIINKKNYNLFCTILIVVTFIDTIYQVIFYIFPSLVFPFISIIFNEKYLQFFEFQYERNRFFGDSLDEAFIPMIIWMFIREKTSIKKILLLLLIIGIIFIAFISNWKTKILILLLSLGVSAIIYLKYIKKYLFLLILLTILTIFLSSSFSLHTVKINIIDRLTFNDRVEKKIINSRINYWKEATEIGLSSPITGVGLGNYYDNLSEKSKLANKNSNTNIHNNFITIDDPHNLFFSTFANTGFLGLISLILLLGYFFITDTFLYKKKQVMSQIFIIIFWSIFIFALFNPWMYFSYLMPFWLIRGFIEKYKIIFNYEKN